MSVPGYWLALSLVLFALNSPVVGAIALGMVLLAMLDEE